ncbi:MAG: Crp/Fnr family transcriptional regulator [Chitinophagaceae bacterium]|nr:MAG: Crp/Fnr family transcriptional regulator [Chitinophagaceae bacterium]
MEKFKSFIIDKGQLTEQEFELLSNKFRIKEINKGQTLLQKGDVCRNAFFVEKGLLKMYSINEHGVKNIIQFAPEDWIVMDRGSAYFNEPTEYFIDAIESSIVVQISEDFMGSAAELNPKFRRFNEILLQNHIRHLQKRISLLIGSSAEVRYLDFIKLYPNLTQRVPQWMIASYLGVAPESLSRVRKELYLKSKK